ncbi:hypothetical protein [Nocardioides sp. CFH 31398]|uniref:hypothetical protein n=1 Tax=Nocardioides sp. CFH 31398 TaxID=2919579 RepID=UPI001F055CCC|nr:hypothetical protein [Nocardioides sp. CFH 31398]MCH1865101.1 hypothetical protein [Nocardioides sp. CFH 31398]
MLDTLKLFADDIATLCVPGETPLAVGGVMYHGGAERAVGQVDPRWRSVRFDGVGLSSARAELAVERMVGGETLRSFPGSDAEAAKRAVEASDNPALLVTDRRVAVVRVAPSPVLHWAVPRERVLHVAHRRHWLWQGRLEVAFVDGSSVRLVAGALLARRATRLARAWAGGR